ncbi:TRAP transporter small permease [Lacicoccus alkaliphilus]|uniref:TRAP-type C4-dicarboxylate transport system, small permease component n=1 Tax=Lacicoccus alkaliphilus DSM 16010 TaxID=1123231 RepID=A0A1M7D0Z4_9BACL|nr:TRAP transporter small permease [Salinicoccus alkaliphilus]SHL73073.1 TRAP-type C4-dicarboxylate transport system, small permease component [Salinicoccus alkaliphilus DSM 16010]
MKQIKLTVDKVILGFASIAIVAMTLLAVWQVIARYILNDPSTLSEEIIRYTLIWFTLLGAAYVFGQNKHITILFIREKFPWKVQLFLTYLAQFAVLLTAIVVFIYGGIRITMLTIPQIAPATGISMGFVYSALPVSGVIILFYTVYNIMTIERTAMTEEEDVTSV